jgi:uncharacterized protein (TIGR00730 family)
MKRLSVFCGSSSGNGSKYEEVAFRMGQILAERKIGLVYGGTNVGLMNSVADGALSAGGEVIGVLPVFISEKGIAHKNLSELILVETMHERKTKMSELSDGVVALPGGFGTLEEFFEVLSWGQLGLHKKPAGILNINGFYDSLIALTTTMVREGFLKEANQKMLIVSDDINTLLDQMKNYTAPNVTKWIIKDHNPDK